MKRVPWTAAGIGLLLVALVLPAAQPDEKTAEAKLRELDEQLERVERAGQERRGARRTASIAPCGTPSGRCRGRTWRSVGAASPARRALHCAPAAGRQSGPEREAQRQQTEADLASQLRAAYFMGRSEPLKLLLNQRNPAEFGTKFDLLRLSGAVAGKPDRRNQREYRQNRRTYRPYRREDAELADLELQQKERVGDLESAERAAQRAVREASKGIPQPRSGNLQTPAGRSSASRAAGQGAEPGHRSDSL